MVVLGQLCLAATEDHSPSADPCRKSFEDQIIKLNAEWRKDKFFWQPSLQGSMLKTPNIL